MMNKSIMKAVVFYAVCFITLVVLIEITWGLTAGVLVGANLGGDKVTQEEVSRILKEKGIKTPDAFKVNEGDWYKNLPPDVKKNIENVVKQNLQAINWFGVTLAVSAFVFAIVGFLCGFINRSFFLIGIIVVLSFLVNNPIVRFPYTQSLSIVQKSIVVFTQFGLCYLFGYFGTSLGKKRDDGKLLDRKD